VYFVIFFIEHISGFPGEIIYYSIKLERTTMIIHPFFEYF